MNAPTLVAPTAARVHSPAAVAARALATALAGAMVVTSATVGSDRGVSADTYTDRIGAAQRQLNADGASAAQLNAEIFAAGNQAAALARAITGLDGQIAGMEAQVSSAQAQLDAIETALSIAQDNLAYQQEQLAGDRRQLGVEMVVMYKAQESSNAFSNFLNSGDFNSFWQHVLDVARLNASERKLIGQVTSETLAIAADVAAITSRKSEQSRLLGTLRSMVTLLNAELSSRQQNERRLQQIEAQDQRTLAANELAQKVLKAQIAALKAQEAAALAAGGGNGRFAWPEHGPITQGFGCTTFEFEPYDPNCPSKHFHSGIDIAAPCGNNITAADSGIVHTYYSNFGFGDHIIMVHGNGWISVYGHMASFTVSDGQTVHRGQLIGHEGDTGNSTGCHLHFEVDLNGTPKNPLAYLS